MAGVGVELPYNNCITDHHLPLPATIHNRVEDIYLLDTLRISALVECNGGLIIIKLACPHFLDPRISFSPALFLHNLGIS